MIKMDWEGIVSKDPKIKFKNYFIFAVEWL